MKQTAVEWLQEAISKKVNNELGPYFIDLFDNAKAMEKEQIDGAKWQQKNSYSEEDMRQSIFTSFLLGVDRGVYSKELEDELINSLNKQD